MLFHYVYLAFLLIFSILFITFHILFMWLFFGNSSFKESLPISNFTFILYLIRKWYSFINLCKAVTSIVIQFCYIFLRFLLYSTIYNIRLLNYNTVYIYEFLDRSKKTILWWILLIYKNNYLFLFFMIIILLYLFHIQFWLKLNKKLV